jgi:hypothetical protein
MLCSRREHYTIITAMHGYLRPYLPPYLYFSNAFMDRADLFWIEIDRVRILYSTLCQSRHHNRRTFIGHRIPKISQ